MGGAPTAPKNADTAISSPVSIPAAPPTGRRRNDIIRSIIGSQALAGVTLSYDQVARALEDAYEEPLEDLE